jgi:hypothetical protein
VCRATPPRYIDISRFRYVWFSCSWGRAACVGGVWLVGLSRVRLHTCGGRWLERFIAPPIRLPLSDSRPLFCDAAHVKYLFCRPRGFVPLSSSCPDVRGFYALGHESSTHVPVCEARPVQRGYASRGLGIVGSRAEGGDRLDCQLLF